MKKRYRSESAIADTSSWPLFSRLHHLLHGTGVSSYGSLPARPLEPHHPSPVLELSPVAQTCSPLQRPSGEVAENNSHESNDVNPMVKENDEMPEKVSDKNNDEDDHLETDSSTPALCSNDKDGVISLKRVKSKKRKR